MKFKPTVFLATFVVTLGLLLGASAAQAATVDLEDDTAVRINNLEVDGTLYNVTFTAGTWPDVYGGTPPQLDVTKISAPDFIEAINIALTDFEARSVGEPGATEDAGFYMIATAWDADPVWVDWLGGYYSGGWIGEIDGNKLGGLYPSFVGSMWANITQFQLNSPKGTITENTPTYTWNAVATTSWYFLQVRGGSETDIFEWYTPEEANCGDGTGECSVTPDTELADGSYNWRILPINDFDFGWSDPLNFNVNTTVPNVIVDENGNVTRIENLPVIDENEEVTIYNVRFVNDWANNVYGDPLTFDFPASVRDETFFGALEAVTDVLNAEDSIPPGASSEGTGQFFIGYNEILRTIVAVGGENIAGGWDQCETECTDGVALLDAGSELTWADFQKVAAPGVVQVFRTSGTYLPGFDFGNLAGGDALCQERAEAVGLNGTWTAWLSDDNTDAIDRIPDGEYQLLSGAGVIADNKDDLTDGSLKAPIFEDEFGGFPAERMQGSDIQVWTGTDADGTGTDANCNNWTNQAGDATFGVSNESDSNWTNTGISTSCGQEWYLYCFGGGQ